MSNPSLRGVYDGPEEEEYSMRSNVFTSIATAMIVCSMLLSAMFATGTANISDAPATGYVDDGSLITDTGALFDSYGPTDKIQPQLLDRVKQSGLVKVFVITNDVAVLAASLKGTGYSGNIGTCAPEVRNIATPLLEVPGYMLDDIASLPGVMRIIEYEVPEKHSSGSMASYDFSDTAREFGLPAEAHWADRVWDMGYNGTGVNVAIIDSGVDFAHPELMGSQARIPDSPATPYSGWPIVFDSASMDAYVAAKGKNESYSDLWYADTSSTDPNIIHSINIDGKNDFWRIEMVAQDPLNNGENLEPPILSEGDFEYYNDYELQELYAQQNYTHWFFGFNTFANNTDVIYTLYIDADGTFNSGATYDPLGNYVNATGWSGGVRNPLNATHMPEYAVTIERLATDSGGNLDKVGRTLFHAWDNAGKTWSTSDLVTDLRGSVGYSGYKYTVTKTGKGFMEFSIPKQHMGNDDNVSFIMFTTGSTPTHAFDTVYSDPAASFTVIDPSSTAITSLTAFTTMSWGYFEHFYNIDEWGPKKNSFPTHFIYPAAWSAHSPVHFGYHPDDNLPLTGICVVASATPGVYDTVYADLDNNLDFSNDKPMKKGNEISYFDCYDMNTKTYDYTTYNAGDGYADISGGMIYYISDGANPVPYLDQYLTRYHLINNTEDPARAKYIEGSGNMVAFTGELDLGETHGTECASSVVGKGKTFVVDSGTLEVTEERHVLGMAPGAKIVTVANAFMGNLFDCWLFAAEGYDGNVTTLGDQPQIAALSFGFGSAYNDGWDTYSKYIDWIMAYYSQGGLTFTASSGDAGPGYGSVTSPASATSVICVGASSDYSSREPNGLENGPNPTWGDAVGFSGRGPSVLGDVKPDVLAVGRQVFGALPLNSMTAKDGSVANEIWMGTSISSSSTAGIMALIYQAYASAHSGAFPASETAKNLLMSGADNIHYDVLQQGAGIVNAYRSVRMALEQQGISSSVPKWVPGGYDGASYEAFAKLMMPGTSDTIDITLDNHGTAVNANIYDGVLKKYAEYEFADTTAYPYNPLSAISYYNDVWFYISNPGKVSSKPHGVYNMDGSHRYVEGDADAWNQAELIKVTARTDETAMDPNGDGAYDYSYWLDMYDWTDIDGNGEMKVSGWTEMNRLNADSPGACTIVLHAREPAKRLHSGLGIGVRLFGDGNSNITWTVTVEMYKTVDWSWLTTSANGLVNIPAAGLGLTATMNVPSDAQPGSYDGAIYVESQMAVANAPIAANPTMTQTNMFLDNTASTKVNNMTIATTPTTAVTNSLLLNTTLHNVPLTAIFNTETTKVSNETLVTTSSMPMQDCLADVTLSAVAGEVVGSTGPSVPVNNEYLGFVTDPAQATAALKQGKPPNMVVQGSLSVYKNGVLFPDSPVQVTNEPVALGYTNNGKLNLAHGNVDPDSLVLMAGATTLTEGVNFAFDWLTGEITVMNLNAGAGVNILATYRYHTGYSLHDETLYFSAPIGAPIHLTASYSVYDYSSFQAPLLAREGEGSDAISEGSVTLYLNGATLIENTDFTMNYETGQISLLKTYGPMKTLTADYAHYTPRGTDYTLTYGRDISQDDDTGGYFLPQFVRQGIMPQKSRLLGFEVLMHENPTTGDLVKVHLIQSIYYDRPHPIPDEEVFTVLASSQKPVTEVKEGWNIFNFASEMTLDMTSGKKYYLGIENANYEIATSASDVHSGSLYLSPTNGDGKWDGAAWVSQSYDIAFRTYNGYIAPGSVDIRLNAAPFTDQVVTKTDQAVVSVTLSQINGEQVSDFLYVEDDMSAVPEHWVINAANSYSVADPLYLTDIKVFVDGVQLAQVEDKYAQNHTIWTAEEDSTDPIPLEVKPHVLDYNLYANLAGTWTYLTESTDYWFDDPVAGQLTLNLALTTGDTVYIYYNYTDRNYLTAGSADMFYGEYKGYWVDAYAKPTEFETGEIWLMNDYTAHYVTLSYGYYRPYFHLGGNPYTTSSDDKENLPMAIGQDSLVGCTVKRNGITLTEGVDYLVDYANGMVQLIPFMSDKYVQNQTIFTAAADSTDQIHLRLECNILDYNLYAKLGGVWTYLSDGSEYWFDDPAQGLLTLSLALSAGDTVHAFYNYTDYETLDLGDTVTATYSYHDKYTIDMDTGDITLTKAPVGGENLTAYYRYYLPYTGSMQLWGGSAGGSSSGSIKTMVASGYIVYVDGKVLPEAGNYALNTVTGQLTPLKPFLANNTYTITYLYYDVYSFFRLPPIGGTPTDWPQIVPGSYSIYRNGVLLTDGVDYTVALDVGRVELAAQLAPDSFITASYTWYLYVNSLQLPHGSQSSASGSRIMPATYSFRNQLGTLTEGADYTFSPVAGLVSFTSQLGPGNMIWANYTWYNTAAAYMLPNEHIVTLYMWNGAVPFTDYILNHDTGVITFSPELGPNCDIKVTYWHYTPPASKVYELGHKNLVPASWSVWVNGVLLLQGVDYTIEPMGTENSNAEITLTNLLGPDQTLTVTYSYYAILSEVKLPYPNLGSLSLNIGATLLVLDTDYSVDMYRGVITFLRPIPADSTVTANYNYLWTTTIPILVNVPATGSSFSVGGPNPYSHDLFNASAFGGGYGNGDGSGDWRFYYTYIPEQGLFNGQDNKFLIDIEWEGALTDCNLHVFGKESLQTNPATNTQFPEDRYGPYTLARKGGSDKTPGFYTTTGGPGEVIALPMTAGLNVIALQNVKMNGSHVTESFSGEVGKLTVSSPELEIVTCKPTGSVSISLVSSMELEGLGGAAAGPSAPSITYNMTVKQDDPDWANYATFQDQLASGGTTIPLEIKDCLILEVRINGHVDHGYKDVTDLDLGLFLDGSNGQPLDGVTQVEEFCAMDADGDADETIRLIKPDDGMYLIRPFGFTLKSDPAHFDLYITTVQGKGFTISGATTDTIAPYTVSTLEVSWVLPGDTSEGKLLGAMFIGPSKAETALLIPISLDYDVTAPNLISMTPSDGASLRDTTPQIVASFSDEEKGQIDARSLEIFVDGESVTHLASCTALYTKKGDTDVYGTWTADISYLPPIALSEGGHIVEVRAADIAGNIRSKIWGFNIDTTAPLLEVSYPAESSFYTNSNTIVVMGQTDPSAELKVLGIVADQLTLNYDGTFNIILTLLPGANDFIIRAADGIGNKQEIQRTVILDTTAPTLTTIRSSAGYITNSQQTTFSGKYSEHGMLTVNGVTQSTNNDGSFERSIRLSEGRNTIEFEFSDMAGNAAHNWQNVTLDTVAPTITLADPATTVTSASFVLTGTVEPGTDLYVNGKPVDVGTRQSSGEFTYTTTLSAGQNVLVIEARDSAGNSAELRHTVEYDTAGTGANYAAISLMVILLIVGLILGILLAPMFIKEKEEAEPAEGELPEGEVAEMPEGEIPETQAEGEEPLEPIPPEESIPEDMPAEEEMPEEPAEPEESEEISEEIPEEPAAEEQPVAPVPAEEEDPRIAKLTEAYNSGKISKELYEKNLVRFKGQK